MPPFFVPSEERGQERLEKLREQQFLISFWSQGSLSWLDVDGLKLPELEWLQKRLPEEWKKINSKGRRGRGRHA